jgi:hypothetical protein
MAYVMIGKASPSDKEYDELLLLTLTGLSGLSGSPALMRSPNTALLHSTGRVISQICFSPFEPYSKRSI